MGSIVLMLPITNHRITTFFYNFGYMVVLTHMDLVVCGSVDHMTEQLLFISLDDAVKIADCPGLTADLIRQLAKRDKILTWGEIPGRGLVIDQQSLLQLASALKRARHNHIGQYITVDEAEAQYGIHRTTWYRYKNRGVIRGKDKNLLYLEDVAFVAKLAEFIKPKSGRPLLPKTYMPNQSRS